MYMRTTIKRILNKTFSYSIIHKNEFNFRSQKYDKALDLFFVIMLDK